jgi:hypothetical protein
MPVDNPELKKFARCGIVRYRVFSWSPARRRPAGSDCGIHIRRPASPHCLFSEGDPVDGSQPGKQKQDKFPKKQAE